jgi:predicted Zn-dependent peptidase
MMASLIDVTAGELEAVAAHGPADAELQRAKAQLKAGLLMSLESSSARAEQMARQMMIYGRLVGTRELVDSVDAVTAEDVLAFAQNLSLSAPTVAVVGAGKASEKMARAAAARLSASRVRPSAAANGGRVAWHS